LSKARAELLSL